ncbi:hypothetical protein C8R44DRAFT_802849 [Mycena epipterygia]|nr:hypothetical protein C8R44DRAFT_802849 [Mycena epipterygia]
MPRPQDFRIRESADARAALMANLHSQLPPYLDTARSRYLQAERPKPYRVPGRPKRRLLAECRRSRPLPSLGWGAFLKDEALRTPQGKLIRAAKGPCPARNPIDPSPRCNPTRPSIEDWGPLRRHCADDGVRDCCMPLWRDPPIKIPRAQRRCSSPSQVDCTEQDCEMPPRDIFECGTFRTDAATSKRNLTFPQPTYESEMPDHLCVKAADEMFCMFIDDSCMEEDH